MKVSRRPLTNWAKTSCAEGGRPEPVLGVGGLPSRADEGLRIGRVEHGPDDRKDDEEQDDRRAEDDPPVAQGEVEDLAPLSHRGRRRRTAAVPGTAEPGTATRRRARTIRHGARGLAVRAHAAPPCIPTRVRGSTMT